MEHFSERRGYAGGRAPHRFPMATFNTINFGKTFTVATLPSPAVLGMERVLTGLTSPTVGSAPVAGGSANAKVWYNGTAWRVVAV